MASRDETLVFLSAGLKARDAQYAHLDEYIRPFDVASERVVKVQQAQTETEKPSGTLMEFSNDELITRLKASRLSVIQELRDTQQQLEQAQERIRAVAEEQYLKTHVVQGLHDEIIALTMQLNLSEERRKKLQDELGR